MEVAGLLRQGLSGPALGRTLEALLDGVIAGELPNEREALLAAVPGLRETPPLSPSEKNSGI